MKKDYIIHVRIDGQDLQKIEQFCVESREALSVVVRDLIHIGIKVKEIDNEEYPQEWYKLK